MSPHVTLPIILAHVPVWVWVLLAFLIYQGIRAMRDSTRPVARVLIFPAIFVIWGVTGLLIGGTGLDRWVAWFVMAAVCVVPGLRLGPRQAQVDPVRHLVHLRGSPWPLIRNVGLFVVKFALAVAMALDPARPDSLGLASAAVSGAMAGYFVGWGATLLMRYREADKPGTATGPTTGPATGPATGLNDAG